MQVNCINLVCEYKWNSNAMVLFGYCYFVVLAVIAASGVVVPIRSRRMGVVYGVVVKCLPCAVLCGYAWKVTSGGVSLLWLLLLVYHAGSLVFSFILITILSRSRYKDTGSEAKQASASTEARRTQILRRAYGTVAYSIHLVLWYTSFGT